MMKDPPTAHERMTKMNKTKIAKFAVSTIAGAGTMHVTDAIVKNNINPDDLNSFGKFTVAAAKVVIGAMAAAKTKEFTDAQIDELIEAWQSSSTDKETPTTA